MERLYGRKRYIGGVRKFEKYNELSGRIWEGDKERRSTINRKKERKTESSKSRVESRDKRV